MSDTCPPDPTVALSSSPSGQAPGTLGRPQGVRLCCPHCHNAVEVVLDKASESVACPLRPDIRPGG